MCLYVTVVVYVGTRLSEVYEGVVSFVKKQRSDLESKMTKSLGFAMGIEFREGSLLISAKTTAKAKKGEKLVLQWLVSLSFSHVGKRHFNRYNLIKHYFINVIGMTFNINVGFGDLVNDGKKYALFLGDTILVNEVCI